MNVTLPPALELEFKNTLNQSVIVSDVRSIRNFTVDEVYDNFFPPIPNGVVCAQAMGQLTLLQSTITTCFELEGAVAVREAPAAALAGRLLTLVWRARKRRRRSASQDPWRCVALRPSGTRACDGSPSSASRRS